MAYPTRKTYPSNSSSHFQDVPIGTTASIDDPDEGDFTDIGIDNAALEIDATVPVERALPKPQFPLAPSSRLQPPGEKRAGGLSPNPKLADKPATNISVDRNAEHRAEQLIDDGRVAATYVLSATAQRESKLVNALEKAWELHRHLRNHTDLAERLYRENKIANTAATKRNEFTRTLKLVFVDEVGSNISRYTMVMHYVAAQWWDDDDEQTLADIVREGGGTVKCATAGSKIKRSPAALRAYEKRAAHRDKLEKTAIAVANPVFETEVEGDLVAILYSRSKGGEHRFLGYREETEKAVSRYRAFQSSKPNPK